MAKLITVLGATGFQGGSVVDALLGSKEWKVRAVTRNVASDKAKNLAKRGAEVVKADFGDREAILAAFKGATAVFAVTISDWTTKDFAGEEKQGKELVDLAVESGTKIFVWSTSTNVQKETGGKITVPQFENKQRVEEYAREKGLTVLAVNPGFFASNVVNFFHGKKEDDGSYTYFAPVRHDVAAPILYGPEYGQLVRLALQKPEEFSKKQIKGATEYLTMTQLLDRIGKVVGAKLNVVRLDLDEFEKKVGKEYASMWRYYDKFGYYLGDKIEKFDAVKYPTVEQWAKENFSLPK